MAPDEVLRYGFTKVINIHLVGKIKLRTKFYSKP